MARKDLHLPNSTRSSYRGYRIVTRWTDLGPLSDRRSNRFDASFTVHPNAIDEESWQEFPKTIFETFVAATANAVAAAHRSIDLNINAEQHDRFRKRMEDEEQKSAKPQRNQ